LPIRNIDRTGIDPRGIDAKGIDPQGHDPGRRRCRGRAAGPFIKRISEERIMGFGRGILLWLLGVPIPIIILLALFWR
jgi:hypothetical protein